MQLSFFAAGAAPAAYGDLDGLLAGPGQVVRRGTTARVSVVVPTVDSWRVAALVAGLDELGAQPEVAVTSDAALTSVRTAWLPELAATAARWARGAAKRPPVGFALDGARLRWWCVAAGAGDAVGHLLRLGDNDEAVWPTVGGALSSAGLPATLLGRRGGGPAYRVVGARRLTRLRELVGEPPPAAPYMAWPQPRRTE